LLLLPRVAGPALLVLLLLLLPCASVIFWPTW